MAAIYPHPVKGYQIHYLLFFPDGSSKKKYRYRKKRLEAQEVYRHAESLEIGSRRQDITQREIVNARHARLLSPEEAKALSGGRLSEPYSYRHVLEHYERTSGISKSVYAHTVDMRRAGQIENWLKEENLTLATLTEDQLKQYIAGRKSGNITFRNKKNNYRKYGVSAKTIKNELQVFRGLLDEAVKLGMVEENIARQVDIPLNNSTVRRTMTPAEIKKLIDTARENSHLCHGYIYEVVILAIYTGLRRAEIRTLQWQDIDLDKRIIKVQSKKILGEAAFNPKGGKAGTVSIPDRLYDVLSGMEQEGKYVFGGESPIVINRFYKSFKEIVSRAGLDPALTLHSARHTYGSRLLQITGDLKYVQDRMRHKDLETTRNYMHTIEQKEAPERKLDYDFDG